MTREQKSETVAQINQTMTENPHLILASFRGLTVNQATALRGQIREAGGRYRVIPNRLAKRAAAGTPAEELASKLEGPCALVSHQSDPVVLAKVLSGFAKDNPAGPAAGRPRRRQGHDRCGRRQGAGDAARHRRAASAAAGADPDAGNDAGPAALDARLPGRARDRRATRGHGRRRRRARKEPRAIQK